MAKAKSRYGVGGARGGAKKGGNGGAKRGGSSRIASLSAAKTNAGLVPGGTVGGKK